MSSPYTVMVDGVPIQCETAEAALELVRLHGGGAPANGGRAGHHREHGNGAPDSRWTDQRVADFFKAIEGHQRKVIDALLHTEDGRTDEQLLQLLGLKNGSALGGVFAGLWKNAKKVGADPRELYIKKPVTIGDVRRVEYTLHEGFRKAAARRPAK